MVGIFRIKFEEMNFIKKISVFLLLIFIGIIIASIYGIVHNQISYTVSPEYFTRFKFIQFGLLDNSIPERIRASIVGFLASWWMGIPIGILIGLVGFIHKGYKRMFKVSLWAICVAVGFTILFGLCGLIYGYFQTSGIDLNDYKYWFIPENVENVRRFLCAGYMHNSAYLGGVLSIFVAWFVHLIIKFREKAEVKILQ